MAYDKNPDGSYVDLEYTKFPAEVDSWQNSEDVTAEYLSLANDYKSALLAGNYGNAQNILNANPQLKRMMISADDINKIKHSTMALERLFIEDIEAYVKSFTDKATSEAEKATTSANSAALSEKSSANSEKAASKKAEEANQLVETLKTLKGTLPSDFTEYTQQIIDHNTNSSAHQDIRKEIEDSKYILPVAKGTVLGGVKIGSGLTVTEDGTVSADSALAAYPVGSIFQTVSLASPASMFGGIWEEIAQERTLMGASDIHAAGSTAEAGLPNITGFIYNVSGWTSNDNKKEDEVASGAFKYRKGEYSSWNFESANYSHRAHKTDFDASLSNAIYGASDTVQPPAYFVHIWHRVA